MLTWLSWAVLGVSMAPWGLAHLGLGRWCRQTGLAPWDGSVAQSVRVVIPARDEAHQIGRCLGALAAQPAGPWRVVVVDDGSTDGTAEVARAAIEADARFEVITAPERASDWAGKAWACHHGAIGDEAWLLFVDADVVLDPRTVATMVRCAIDGDRDMISVFGRWDLRTAWERLLIPAFGWVIRGAVDAPRVRAGTQAFANGQCLLISRRAYRAIGGHEAVATSILDDVDLARQARDRGARLDVRWAPWAFSVRLYRSLFEIWSGYRKNLHPGLGRGRAVSVVAAAALIIAGLGPSMMVLWAAWTGEPFLAVAAGGVCASQIAMRWRLDWLDGRRLSWVGLLHGPATAAVGLALAASALGRAAVWRGRAFVDGRAR